ncbi:MAG: thermonuclease family protein [bacterium]
MKIKNLILCCLLFISHIACASKTDSSLIIGDFMISKVTDGDTFRFKNLDKPVRLLGIDTEETFKTPDAEQKINEISQNWEAFYKAEKGDNKMPVKTDSPLGFEAWKWAEDFFQNVDHVRLEREDDDRTIDIFGRYLVYVIAVMKDATEINYNVECVRKGYSPYFNKYGNSKRFHDEFVEAQNYAKQNNIGIWDPNKKHYPDYEERLAWWSLRADQLTSYESNYTGRENYFNLSSAKDFARLSNYVGQEVTVFGSIGEVKTEKFPYILRIPYTKEDRFELIVHEENAGLLQEMDIETKKNYYVFIKGKLENYNGTYQIVLRDKDQLWIQP